MEAIDKIKEALKPDKTVEEKVIAAEKLYWLYRKAKENPEELQIAFLLEANRLQKQVIDSVEEGGHF